MAVAAMLLLWVDSGPARAAPLNLVTDGTFQDTAVTGGGGFLCQNTGGSTCTSNLAYWSATCSQGGCVGTSSPSSILLAGSNGAAWNGGFGLYGSNLTTPPGGGNVIGIDGAAQYDSTISQTISGLSVGTSYLLQFYQSASQQIGQSGATTEQFQVTLGASTQTSPLQNTPSQTQTPWQKVSLSFVATAASEVLSFLALGTPNSEPPVALLADVSLQSQSQPVPEPASLALVGAAGLLTLGLAVRRRASLE